MRNIIKAIKTLIETNPTVYLGDGEFCSLDLKVNKGIPKKELNSCEMQLPKEYKAFLSAYNGIQFLEGACVFYDFETAQKYTYWYTEKESKLYKDRYLSCATVVGDYFFIDLKSSEGEIFLTREGIGKFETLNICFKDFLDIMLSANTFKFWDYRPL